MQSNVKIRDVILAISASTDSSINKIRFKGLDYAPTANFTLLKNAYDIALAKDIKIKMGSVLTTDTFYNDNPDSWKHWANYGLLAVEMETAALYTLASKFKVKALSILTVSDSLITHEETSSKERQKTFNQMVGSRLGFSESIGEIFYLT